MRQVQDVMEQLMDDDLTTARMVEVRPHTDNPAAHVRITLMAVLGKQDVGCLVGHDANVVRAES